MCVYIIYIYIHIHIYICVCWHGMVYTPTPTHRYIVTVVDTCFQEKRNQNRPGSCTPVNHARTNLPGGGE